MKTIEELETKLKEFGKEIEALKKELESVATLLVPDNIKICSYGDGTQGIINGKQILNYNIDVYEVRKYFGINEQKYKLVKTTKEELEPGDVVYTSNSDLNNKEDLCCYHLVLEDGSFQYWSGKELRNDTQKYNFYYKAVLINN